MALVTNAIETPAAETSAGSTGSIVAPGARGASPAGEGGPATHLPRIRAARRRVGAREFDFDRRTAIMAIINRTPDSFYDRGATFALDRAVDAAIAAVEAGADILDIGGVPFSPDVPPVSAAEEADRVVPLVERIRARTDAVISIDTTRGAVAAAALDAGADLINDTNGLRDEELLAVVAAERAHVVVAHSIAKPFTHHRAPRYDDVVREVGDYLRERVEAVRSAGVPDERILIDPGHDLNKNTLHTLELCRRLAPIADLGLPLLVALSNKDFVGETLDRERGDRVAGTLAATVMCVQQGARIVRTHNVRETVDAVRMTETILGLRAPAYLRHNIDVGAESATR